MGKHDAAAPMNETLEKHYQESIKILNTKVNASRDAINELMAEIEKLKFEIQMKDAHIEELNKALVERTIAAAMR